MEEEIKNGEQPEVVKSVEAENTTGSPECDEQAEVGEDRSEAERGVPVGKFKNTQDLLDAYENLQAQFTKKCQRLSVLEKEKAQENKHSEFEVFLSRNADAVAYADEIQQKANDEGLRNQEGKYDLAWASILYEKLTSPNRSQEPLVQNLILKDEELKKVVIENYVKQLQKQNIPVIISNSGERVTKTVAPKPDTFEQAKSVVLDMFSKG